MRQLESWFLQSETDQCLDFLRPFLENVKVTAIVEQFSLPTAHEDFAYDNSLIDAEKVAKVKTIGRKLAKA